MAGRGQLFLHDIRVNSLENARRRCRRAGLQNVQFLPPLTGEEGQQHPFWKKKKGKMDWVVLDVPCSGTGTLRRNPDLKEKITEEFVERLIGQQREIMAQALPYLRPGRGRLVYITCSLLEEENQGQVGYFLEKHPLRLEGEPWQVFPSVGGMDGFFAASFAPLDTFDPLASFEP